MTLNNREKLALRLIDTWLDYRFRYSNFPGFQVCIRKEGTSIFNKAYGYANLKTRRELGRQDLFHIASHSKTFTACALLQLEDQKKINLQQTAVEYIPQLKAHKDERFKQITIRDLLSNRSGLFRDGIDGCFWALEKPFLSREQLIQEVLSSDLIYDPNTHSKYSNMGFALLGLIIENILGISYQEAIDRLILSKLNSTQIFPDFSEDLNARFADGHTRPMAEGMRHPIKHVAAQALASATGFCANTESSTLFFDRLLLGSEFLEKKSQRDLLSLNWLIKNSTSERYGLGVQFDRFSDIDLIGHSGGYPGFVTHTRHWMGTGYVVSFFLNTNAHIPGDAVKSIITIIQKVNTLFTEAECAKASIAGPLLNKWGGSLFVFTPTKGLYLNIESWLPCEEALYLEGDKSGAYICPKENGYASVGEKICFDKNSDGTIHSVKWGGFTTYKESIFLKKLEVIVDHAKGI